MIKLSFVGDIMCEMQQTEASCKNGTYNYKSCFESVKKDFEDSDIFIGNLETPLAGEYLVYTNHPWLFNTPVEFAKAIKDELGIDLVSTANNHCLDRGVEGLENTVKALKEIKLNYTGTCLKNESNEPFIFEKNGIRIGIVSYTYGTNAIFNKNYLKPSEKHIVNIFEEQEKKISRYNIFSRLIKKLNRNKKIMKNIQGDINELKNKVDYVIMCMHAGGQHNNVIDKYTLNLMDILKKVGVDLVVGCHPHVVQRGIFTKKFIGTYSLGNFFCTPGTSSSPLDKLSDYSIALHVYLEKEESFKIRKVTFSIYKTIIDNFKSAKTVLLYDLIKENINNEDVKVLLKDNCTIYNTFCNSKYDEIELQKEYEIKIEELYE